MTMNDAGGEAETTDQPSTPEVGKHAPGQAAPRAGVNVIESSTEEAPTSPTPAAARAAQVEMAVKAENATGQPAITDIGTHPHAAPTASSHAASASTALADSVGAQLLPQSDAHIEDGEFSPQIVRGLNAMLNQRGGVMKMRLDPPELGELRVQMTIVRGVVTAEFQASNHQAQALLDRSLATLRTALESQGLSVDRLSVHMSPQAQQSSSNDDSGGQYNPQHQRSQSDAGQGESRGRRDFNGHSSGDSHSGHRGAEPRHFDLSSLFDSETMTPA